MSRKMPGRTTAASSKPARSSDRIALDGWSFGVYVSAAPARRAARASAASTRAVLALLR